MSTREMREKLVDYVRSADDRKVKAMYTIIEKEIEEDENIWTDEFVEELNKRNTDLDSGKVKGLTWKQVKARVKESSRQKRG